MSCVPISAAGGVAIFLNGAAVAAHEAVTSSARLLPHVGRAAALLLLLLLLLLLPQRNWGGKVLDHIFHQSAE